MCDKQFMKPCIRQLGTGMDREARRSRTKNIVYLRRDPFQRRVMPFEKLVDESLEGVKVSMIKIRIQNGAVVRGKTTCDEKRQRFDERVLSVSFDDSLTTSHITSHLHSSSEGVVKYWVM